MIFLKIFFIILSVNFTLATTKYDVISQGRKPELRQDNFETFRLPNNTRPLAYDVSLRTWIDQGNLTFTGSVRIRIIALESTDTITLHHRELVVGDILVSTVAGDIIVTGEVSYNSELEFLTIPVLSNLVEGNEYFIEVQYSGTMQTTWSGFYAIRYVNSEGNMVYYGSTQFEATDARRAFPCYDEIGMKALFTIRITHDPSFSAISNMPAVSEDPVQNPDGSVTTEFQQTPLMSTYLIAFHVSDFAHTLSSAASVPHRIFTRPSVVNLTSRALRTSEILLDAFSEHFGVDYALPKLDSVSLPEFGGAMENFGMITYSDYYMVFDENIDGFEKTITSVQTIGHEQAHMWFGNLVTPIWWTYVWLKEGFATLFQHYGIDLIYPDWNMKDYMLVTTVHNVLRYESYYGLNRPMTHYVEQPLDIDSLFDNISYSKAGSVLRMFLLAFGEETFMDGIRSYLSDNSFSVVTEEDLFDALALSIWLENEMFIPPTTNVTAIMSSWTRQAGFPLVTIVRNYERDSEQVTLSQTRYFYPTIPIDPDNTTFWIPYNYATPDNPGFNSSRATGWIPQNENTITITVNGLDAEDYFLFDTHAGGYYRVIYDERNYRLISDAMVQNASQFHGTSKASLLENVREFFGAGQLTMATVLDVLRILEDEDNYVVWYPVRSLLLEIDTIFSVHQNHAVLRDFIRNLVEQLYDTVGIEDVPDEPILRKPARQLAISLACNLGSVHCRSDALRQLRQLIVTGGEFHQNIRTQMYCAALRSANSNDFNFVWNRMLTSQNSNQRNQLSQSLGCLTSRSLINQLLRSLLPSTNVDNVVYQDNEAYRVFRSVYENGMFGLELTLDFVIENAIETFSTLGSNEAYFLIDMAPSIRRTDITQKFRQLLEIYVEEGLIAQPVVYTVEEIMYETRELFEQHSLIIDQWLTANYS